MLDTIAATDPAWVSPAQRAGKLSSFLLGMAAMRAGGPDCRALWVGDSTPKGATTSTAGTVPDFKAGAARVGALFGGAIGLTNGPYNGSVDTRWSAAGWTTSEWGAKGYESGSAGPLTYTPGDGETFDRFDIYYIQGPGGGSASAVATGGSAVVTSLLAGSYSIIKATALCAVAAVNNAVTITRTGQVWILGIEPWLSTRPRLRVGNIGIYGATANSWVAAGAQPTLNRLAMITAYAPHLTVIMLGLNDAAASVTPAAFYTDLLTLAQTAVAAGSSVILMPPMPPGGAAPGLLYPGVQSYLSAYAAVATAVGGLLINTWQRHGGTYRSTLLSADGYHPNDLGHADFAAAVYEQLGLLAGPTASGTAVLNFGSITAPSLSFTGASTSGFFWNPGLTGIGVTLSGSTLATWRSIALQMSVPVNPISGGAVDLGTATAYWRTGFFGTSKHNPATFSSLGTAAAAGNGARAYITDSTLAYTSANLGAAAAGGGANHTWVSALNGAWVIG